MVNHSLFNIFKTRVQPSVEQVYVVPLIRPEFPKTDYLSLLYAPLKANNPRVQIHSISVWSHFRFIIAQSVGHKPILHYHWLEFQDMKSALAMPYKLFCIWLYCTLGGKLVWTVHNLEPHSKRWVSLHQGMHRWMARNASVVLTHSRSAARLAEEYLQVNPVKLVVHPHPSFPAAILPKEMALKAFKKLINSNLESNTPILLMAGAISRYKGILEVIEVLQSIPGAWRIVIAGYVKKGQSKLAEAIYKKAAEDPRVSFLPRFIQEDEYSILFSAADVCLFNFSDILTSGGVEMARAYQKSIYLPDLPALQDYKGHDLIRFFTSIDDLREQLLIFMQEYRNG
jgi:glycosyltransferase involved in cell wall biosynthesis